jgi:hypothetical protein
MGRNRASGSLAIVVQTLLSSVSALPLPTRGKKGIMARIVRCGYVIALACALLLGVAVPSYGHHSFAVYDFEQQIPFEGVVATLNFKNPHISMTLTVTRADGKIETINFVEGAPANMAVRGGLTPDMIKPGTRITAIGSPRKDDPNAYFIRKIRLGDGREFL